MRVLAEIRWCETHEDFVPSNMEQCRSWLYLPNAASTECVVVDAQVAAKCADCNGTQIVIDKWQPEGGGEVDTQVPCPSCSEEAPPVAAIQAALLLKESILTQTAFPNSVTALIAAAERVVAAYRGTDDGT